MGDWISTCTEVGGAPEPAWETCVGKSNGCEAFKGAICKLSNEDIINQFEFALNANECQVSISRAQ